MEGISSREYSKTIAAIKSKGYDVKFVPIKWRRTTIDDWVNELWKEYDKYNPGDVILAGFSFGAMTAFAAASKKNPKELWLFSLSPYFGEDMSSLKKSWRKSIGKRKAAAFERISSGAMAKSIECRTLLFIGEKEAKTYPTLRVRANAVRGALKNSRLVVVPETEHDVSDDRYISAIVANI
ncbi:hypothetical protein A3A71_00345 [Candidatus Berkelbacteria bacterium RIFCSPLOWO2_01_FULL_50_28]|uniref:Alpha/beta hydrolase n=1 Tax=Candidatus Berkelbacteria bacterium RIFCSPLOWO2_01_FULL_50_28 TaxID=1797471 RepID=A0A1F5EAR4_9BACT|nr:MAG: hypothetical protein A2807_02255 [Candidatus Berkelbacteria bacterium RIFCSPHIGHO2_01_FULL_50_36]OGD63550.1 MAG: hypothetical protein A3F39_02495 [Candidatus Berkelbacteria bacterium RIFCSPHIGHO2_12_FULL_50_11]OGD64497.1 MAG: hypothetical protein A3A71_00345 [Candidatus Berkelbacteria bacterium RIFCSPLOWO2_01_FULL_50_28]